MTRTCNRPVCCDEQMCSASLVVLFLPTLFNDAQRESALHLKLRMTMATAFSVGMMLVVSLKLVPTVDYEVELPLTRISG